MPETDTLSYKSYLLRLRYAGPAAGWHCSLQDTITGEDHRFADLAGSSCMSSQVRHNWLITMMNLRTYERNAPADSAGATIQTGRRFHPTHTRLEGQTRRQARAR